MCNRYRAVSVTVVRDVFGFTLLEQPQPLYATHGTGPWQTGPFIRAGSAAVGQWGLIPWFSATRRPTGRGGRPISTNNCRVETVATAPTFKGPPARAQRCLIPALDYDEPYWARGATSGGASRGATPRRGRWRGCGPNGPTRRAAKSS